MKHMEDPIGVWLINPQHNDDIYIFDLVTLSWLDDYDDNGDDDEKTKYKFSNSRKS